MADEGRERPGSASAQPTPCDKRAAGVRPPWPRPARTRTTGRCPRRWGRCSCTRARGCRVGRRARDVVGKRCGGARRLLVTHRTPLSGARGDVASNRGPAAEIVTVGRRRRPKVPSLRVLPNRAGRQRITSTVGKLLWPPERCQRRGRGWAEGVDSGRSVDKEAVAMLTSPRPALLLSLAVALAVSGVAPAAEPPRRLYLVFTGRDLTGWKVPDGDNGHWKVVDGVIDYDAQSEAHGDERTSGPSASSATSCCRSIGASRRRRSSTRTSRSSCPTARTPGRKGDPALAARLRLGHHGERASKVQVNIWCWPIGSGNCTITGWTAICRPRSVPA